MRLEHFEYVTPKKDYNFKSNVIFSNKAFLVDAKKLKKTLTPEKLDKLIKKYNIDNTYRDEVEYYIKNDGMHNTDHMFDKDGLVIEIPKKKILDYYYLKVGPNTKKQDLFSAWDMMKAFRDSVSPRNRKKIYQERDKLIFDLAKEGLSWQEIMEAVKGKFGVTIMESNIRTIVSDTCDKLNIPKEDRPKVTSRKIKDKKKIRDK
jgi:hypothetical protein